jgi:radical SAM protein with 4Fe4S-binding SPASM domain
MVNKLRTLKSPLSVNYEVSPVCDLSCEFCFNADPSCKKNNHSPFPKVKSILDALHEAEVFEVRFFGGEFFIYPYWEDCLVYANQLDFFLSFVSNGTHIDNRVVKILKNNKICGGAISLHGLPDIHDKITGQKGSFELTFGGIRACLDNDINISILYTLTKSNIEYIYPTMKFLRERGLVIDELNVGRLTPYGKAKKDWESRKLSLADYLKVFSQLVMIRRDLGILASIGDAFPLCSLPKEYHELVIGCWQGTGFGHIDYLGNVRSCSIAKGSYGNILEENLVDIWTNKLEEFRSLSWLPEKCRQCGNFCGGGCSASRYEGGMYAPDEFI